MGIFQSQRQQSCQIITVIQKTIHEEHNVIYTRIFKHVNLETIGFRMLALGAGRGWRDPPRGVATGAAQGSFWLSGTNLSWTSRYRITVHFVVFRISFPVLEAPGPCLWEDLGHLSPSNPPLILHI